MSSSTSLRILEHTSTPVILLDSHNLDALMLEIERLEPFPDLIVTVRLERRDKLVTLEGQVDALRAVIWDDPRIDLVNAKAFEARRSGAVPFTLDVRDWMTHSSTEDGDAGEVMGEVSDQAKLDGQTEDRKPDETQNQNNHTMQEIAGKRTDPARRGRGRKLGREGKVDERKVCKSTAEMEHEEVERQSATIGYYPAAEVDGGDSQ